jgi:tetratricopeptide (TPR) repeat protein
MKNTLLSRFTPSLMSAQVLEDIFVQRQEEARRIVDLICESILTPSKHYTLLIGPRGIGKTHFVSLVYHRLCKMDDLRSGLLIAWLREEEWGVASFLDLLLRIFRALLEEYRGREPLISGLSDRLEALYQMPPDVAKKTATTLLKEVIGNRTLLLLMENLDELFAGLEEEGQLQFRAFLQENSCCTILATSQSLFNGVKFQTSPFYGFFRIYNLKDLTPTEATQLLANIAKLERKTDLENFILTSTGYARIQAVHHLAGGNPRLYVIFSEFLTCESLDELQEPFMRMLDDLTPYYQARMQLLSPQQRKIVEILSEFRHAVPVKEIAQRSFITHQTTSSQLKDLRDMGYVTSEAVGRESYYELREPLMRFCLEVKKQRGEPLRLFVDFLRFWYTREELQQKLRLGSNDINTNEVWGNPRQYLTEEPIDKFLPPQESNSRYQQLLEPLQADAVVDRVYLLKALEVMEQDDEQDPLLAAYLQEYENLIGNNEYLTALQYSEKLVEKRGWIKDWILRANCLNKLKRYEEALVSCDKAIELDPNYRWAWALRASALNSLKRYEEALASCDKAIEVDPNYTWGLGIASLST